MSNNYVKCYFLCYFPQNPSKMLSRVVLVNDAWLLSQDDDHENIFIQFPPPPSVFTEYNSAPELFIVGTKLPGISGNRVIKKLKSDHFEQKLMISSVAVFPLTISFILYQFALWIEVAVLLKKYLLLMHHQI